VLLVVVVVVVVVASIESQADSSVDINGIV